jgi:hypothetical protein
MFVSLNFEFCVWKRKNRFSLSSGCSLAKSSGDIERMYDYKRHRIKSKRVYNVDAYGFILQDDSNSSTQPEFVNFFVPFNLPFLVTSSQNEKVPHILLSSQIIETLRTKEQEKWQRAINKLNLYSKRSRRRVCTLPVIVIIWKPFFQS